jgi:chemotaxis protein MotB
MAAISRGRRREFNAWPGYVDVLSTLLMVVIFVLMVFVIAQVFLSRALTGSQDALAELQTQLAALSNTLAMRVEEKEKLSSRW